MNAPDGLKPMIETLPPEIQPFVHSGGWLIPVALVLFILLAIGLAVVRRLFKRRRPAVPESELIEDLATYPPPPALWGTKRLTVHGLPVRVRLIVAAPLGHEGGYVAADQIEPMLEMVVPGLGVFVSADKPRLRVWPTQLSYQGFTAAFRRNTQRPDGDRQVSRWVLLMGRGLVNRRPVVFGFALLADQENTLSRVVLDRPHEWMQALRIQG